MVGLEYICHRNGKHPLFCCILILDNYNTNLNNNTKNNGSKILQE